MPSFEDLQRINKANSIINRSNINLGIRPMYLHTEPEEEVQEELFEAFEEDFIIEEVEINEKEIFRSNSLSEKLRQDIKEKLKEAKEKEIITAEEYYAQANSLDEDFCVEEFTNLQEEHEYFEEAAEYYQEEEPSPKVEIYYKQPRNFFDAEELNAEPLFANSQKISKAEEFKVQTSLSFSKTAIYTAFAVIAAVFLIFTFKPVSTAPDINIKLEETKLQELTKTINSSEPRSLIITSGSFLKKGEAESYKQALNSKLGVPLKIVAEENTFSVQIGPAYANHEDALLVFDELSRYSVKKLSIKVAA